MKKKGFVKLVISAAAVVTMCVGFTGCLDDVKDVYKEKETEKPNEFDFSTKKTVEFTLKYDVPTGYCVRFEMYTKSPVTLDGYKSYVKDSTLVSFFSGTANEDGSVKFKGELPATVNEIYAYSPAIGTPLLMKASVSDAGIVSAFEKTDVKAAAPVTRADANAGGPSGTSLWTTYNVTLDKPDLEIASMTITNADKALIDKSFMENQNYDLVTTYYRPSIKLNEAANIKIYSVVNGKNSERTNALAYYVYTKDDDAVKPIDVNSNLNLVFPILTKTEPKEGEGYELKYNGSAEFPKGTHIGFALFPDITPDNITTNNARVLYSSYSTGTWNSYNFPKNIESGVDALNRKSVPHMVMSWLRTDANGHAIIAIGFEDQPFSTTNGTNRGDFRDDIFIVEVTPASSLPEDLPTPPAEVPEWNREFNVSGILCFEDCWPATGDYDINDIVVGYSRTFCYKDFIPVALKETFTFLHNGADYKNGFGYQLLGLNRGNIQKCTVTSNYLYQGHGLDATSDEAIVMLFDDGKSVPKGTTFDVFTSFSGGQALLQEFNPFIVVRNGTYGKDDILSKERTEVHLPTAKANATIKYLPTSKASTAYWGVEDDKSDVANKIYYVREGSYPFALDIKWDSNKNGDVTKFFVPKEKKAIEQTYSKFNSWVNSNGDRDADWYLHPTK